MNNKEMPKEEIIPQIGFRLRNINQFHMITKEEKRYLTEPQSSMQIRYNNSNLIWSVEQIKEKLAVHRLYAKEFNQKFTQAFGGCSFWGNIKDES